MAEDDCDEETVLIAGLAAGTGRVLLFMGHVDLFFKEEEKSA